MWCECKNDVIGLNLYIQAGAKSTEISGLHDGCAVDANCVFQVEIPPKHAVASIVGFIKGKSAMMIARRFLHKDRNFVGEHFQVRGYAVLTVGFELEVVKKYIREQEANDESGRF